jgi:hypothetical protein
MTWQMVLWAGLACWAVALGVAWWGEGQDR